MVIRDNKTFFLERWLEMRDRVRATARRLATQVQAAREEAASRGQEAAQESGADKGRSAR